MIDYVSFKNGAERTNTGGNLCKKDCLVRQPFKKIFYCSRLVSGVKFKLINTYA